MISPARLTLLTTVGLLAAPAPALAGVDIVAPRPRTPLAAGKVTLDLGVRGTVKDLVVRFDGADVTRRLRGTRNRTAVVDAPRGRHRVEARWRDGRGEAHHAGRDFVTGRDNPRLLEIVKAPRSSPGLVRLRVKVARGVKDAVVLVNGKRTRLPATGGVAHTFDLTVGARHGTRFGANRVALVALRSDPAEYDREALSVDVPRTRPMAAGLSRFNAVANRPALVDGRGAKASNPARRVDYRWTVASKPKGASVRIAGRTSPRPRVTADRPGRYRLRLTLTERRPGAAGAAAAGPATTQLVTLMNGQVPVPTAGLWLQGAEPDGSNTDTTLGWAALKLGDTLYQQGDWNGPMVLALDAKSLTPLTLTGSYGNEAYTDTIPVVGSSNPDQTIRDSLAGLQGLSSDPMLVIISSRIQQYAGNIATTLIDPANPSTYVFAYDPSQSDYGISQGWSAVAQSPWANADGQLSGWVARGYAESANQSGYVNNNGVYTFQRGPDVPFDTQAATSAGSNTMVIGSQRLSATIPDGTTNGFQLVAINPRAGSQVIHNQAYSATQMGAFAQDLTNLAEQPNATVFVQSIGTPAPQDAGWDAAGDALTRLGGVTAGLVSLGQISGGSYAFAGAVGADASKVPAGTTGATAAEATPLLDPPTITDHSTKQLTGYLAPTQHGGLEPVAAAQTDGSGIGALEALMVAPPTGSEETFDDPGEQSVLEALRDNELSGVSDQFGASCYPGFSTQLTLAEQVRGEYCNAAVDFDAAADALRTYATGTPVPGYAGDPQTAIKVTTELYREYKAVAGIGGFSAFGAAIDHTNANLLGTKAADAVDLSSLTSQVSQPSGAIAKVNDSLSMASASLGVIASVAGSVPGLGLIGSLGGAARSAISMYEEFKPQQPAPLKVDPSTLTTQASSQLDAMHASLQAAIDRFAVDPDKLRRAQVNVLGGSTAIDDPLPDFSADWSVTTGNSAAFDAAWKVTLQNQLGLAYIGAAFKIFQLPARIGDAFNPQSGPAGLECNYTEAAVQKSFQPWYGSTPVDAWLPREHWTPTMVWALWKRDSANTSPIARGPSNATRAGFALPPAVWTQLTGTGGSQWAIAPAAVFLSGGATIQQITLDQLLGDYDGCDW